MKTSKYLFFVMLFLAVAAAFNACKKDEDENITEDATDVEENVLAESFFNDAFQQATAGSFSLEGKGSAKDFFGDCIPEITVTFPNGTPYPRIVTINFGETNCEGIDGVLRRGKIIFTNSDWLINTGSTHAVTFENYYVNDYHIEGTQTISYNGLNGSLNPTFSVTLVNGKITNPAGNSISHNYVHTHEWISGALTPLNIFDDKISITGTSAGVNRRGVAYTATITEPLIKATSCLWIESGVVTFTNSNGKILTLDFGDGECDNLATVTLNGISKEITLTFN